MRAASVGSPAMGYWGRMVFPREEYADVPLTRHDNQLQPIVGYFPTDPEGRLPGGRRA